MIAAALRTLSWGAPSSVSHTSMSWTQASSQLLLAAAVGAAGTGPVGGTSAARCGKDVSQMSSAAAQASSSLAEMGMSWLARPSVGELAVAARRRCWVSQSVKAASQASSSLCVVAIVVVLTGAVLGWSDDCLCSMLGCVWGASGERGCLPA